MFGVPVRYLLKHPLAAADLAADPLGVVSGARDIYIAQREQRGPQCPYQSDADWERRIHHHLGVAWPCPVAAEFHDLWPRVIAEMEAHGVQAGPESFGSWNDGDAGFVRAIWCLTRHLRPDKVVETGVAHGVTSRFILEALQKNGRGHLWSIDVPPLERFLQKQVGVAVGGRYPDRWSYIEGSSRRRLPSLLAQLGQIDLFIHDSLHSERNVRFELDRAWVALRPGGAIAVDDVDANWGFHSFTQTFSGLQSAIGDAEPLRPDLRRFNQKGLFGVIVKEQTAGLALDRKAG
jgi:methyltransferase family protein